MADLLRPVQWQLPLALVLISSLTRFSIAGAAIRAVNLGGWLVTEGWIKPSLFDGIPNKDYTDGTMLRLKSVTQQNFLCAEKGGGSTVVVNRAKADIWETFRLWRITSNTFTFRTNNGQFLGLDDQGNVVATSSDPNLAAIFEIVINRDETSRVRILANNGFYLHAKSDVLVAADYDKETTSWGDDDPSVFQMTRIQGPQGDFQFANAYMSELDSEVLREGLRLQFMSVTQQLYLCAENGGGTNLVVNRVTALDWETFRLWRITSSSFMLRVNNGQFIGLDNQGIAVATSSDPDMAHQKFEIVVNADFSRARIKAKNGNFLQAKSDVLVTADYSKQSTTWGDDDPSVFLLTRISPDSQGQIKITSGYGTALGQKILEDHMNTYIVEDDFIFMSQSNLNDVRIPVGWWIACDPSPPFPFFPGSLKALDNAFIWAEQYNIKVIIDLHAVPGSQNGYEHSATRDYSQDWGTTDDTINQSVAVIDFLAARYADRTALLAIELLNEPLAPGVTLETLQKYYRAGYDAIRMYTSDAYVIMSNRVLGSPTELLQFASGFERSVLDVHYYNLFWTEKFDNMTVQQNIDFIIYDRAAELGSVDNNTNGPLVFVGEWTGEWRVQGATKEDYQRFVQAQLNVYGKASFGWAYWSLKNVQNHWNLTWMIQNGYITL